jgi:hypothetical protein
MPQVNDLVLNNNHSLTCMRQLYIIMPQVNDLVLNNNYSLTCMRQLYLLMPLEALSDTTCLIQVSE